MKKQPTTSTSGALVRLFKATISAVLLAAFILLLSGHTSYAGSATWRINPVSGDWNTAANWMPMTVPNGTADTATLDFSNITDVSLSAGTIVNGIVFNAGASAFTITATPTTAVFNLLIGGAGITNNSGITQNFVAANSGDSGSHGRIVFDNSATAGTLTVFTNEGGTADSQYNSTEFFGKSTAGNGTFTNNGATVSGAIGGQTIFSTRSTAGNATVTANGATASGAEGGGTTFFDPCSAGNATLIANGGSGGGTGGSIRFCDQSRGGTARVEVFGNGKLDISCHPGLTVGSIEGDGDVFLGANNLTVGSNNLSTNFSGVIQDGGNLGGRGVDH